MRFANDSIRDKWLDPVYCISNIGTSSTMNINLVKSNLPGCIRVVIHLNDSGMNSFVATTSDPLVNARVISIEENHGALLNNLPIKDSHF